MAESVRFSCLLAALTIVLAASSASAHQDVSGMSPSVPLTYSFGEPGDFAEVTRKVIITLRDMSFEPSELTVKKGESIRFVITNTSAIDHDFTLGDEATQIEHRKEMAAMTDMSAAHHHRHHAYAMLVPAGETRVLIWTFSRPGEFEYDCNMPGHFEAGMRGRIKVE